MPEKTDRLAEAALTLRGGRMGGENTRRHILAKATDLASLAGLEGLTIGRLAAQLSLSKSGLFAHFGSKKELQAAVVDHATEMFLSEVVVPVLNVDRGAPRLAAMLESWLSYVERSVFPGGCFFASASLEFDDRPGKVRDILALRTRWWLESIEEEIRVAQARAHFRAGIDPAQLAFELHALGQEANWGFQMFRDPRWFKRTRKSFADALARAAAPRRSSHSPRRRRRPPR